MDINGIRTLWIYPINGYSYGWLMDTSANKYSFMISIYIYIYGYLSTLSNHNYYYSNYSIL